MGWRWWPVAVLLACAAAVTACDEAKSPATSAVPDAAAPDAAVPDAATPDTGGCPAEMPADVACSVPAGTSCDYSMSHMCRQCGGFLWTFADHPERCVCESGHWICRDTDAIDCFAVTCSNQDRIFTDPGCATRSHADGCGGQGGGAGTAGSGAGGASGGGSS